MRTGIIAILFMMLSAALRADDSIALAPVVVEARAVPVCMKGDTIVFGVSSFVSQQGERLRMLLQALPGVEVTADGTIIAKGKKVDRLLINGRELTGLNESVLLNNLKADCLVSIRLYDDDNERDKETGVATEAREQVMDLVTSEENRAGWLCDMTAGAGTKDRYSANGSASRFSDTWQNMFTATFDNLPETFGVGDSYHDKLRRSASSSDGHKRNIGAFAGWEKGGWKLEGGTYYNGTDTRDGNRSVFESLLPGMESVQASHENSRNRSHSLNAQMGMEWKGKRTIVHIDPSFVWDHDNGSDLHESEMHNERNETVNQQRGNNNHTNENVNAELNVRLNRKLGNKEGRNMDISGGMVYDMQRENTADGNEIFYAIRGQEEHSLRLSNGETSNTTSRMRLSYVEPLSRNVKMQGEYSVSYKHNKADHPVYLVNWKPVGIVGYDGLQREDSLSRKADRDELKQQGRVALQITKGKMRLTVGGVVENNSAHVKYKRHRLDLDTVRHTTDWNPEVHFTFRGDKGWNVTASYDGSSVSPYILNLIPVDDNRDPLNIRCGNPGLKPSFIHSMYVNVFFFNPEHERQVNLTAKVDLAHRFVTDAVEYDPISGKRRYTPVNVNGTSSVRCSWGYQSAYLADKVLYLDMQGEADIRRRVGVQRLLGFEDYEYVTRQAKVKQFVSLQLCKNGASIKPYGYGSYERLRSNLAGALERDLFMFGYGGVAKYDAPFGFSIAVDVYNHCRRGYAEEYLNTDELIIDAEVSMAFLKERNAELRIMVCDMLGRRQMVEGYTRTSGRSEIQYDRAVNSYAMATLTYRF